MNRFDDLSKKYFQAPWRKQSQVLGLALIIVIFITLFAAVYLHISARTAEVGRQIQVMQNDLDELDRQIEDMRSQLALIKSSDEMEKRADALGFKPLSYRGRSEQELRERLTKKGFSQMEVIATIHDLKQSGLVDDANLAETLKWEAFTAKLLSTEGARRYVLGRGIPRGIAETAFVYDEERDKENARRLLEKKLRIATHYPFATVRRRLYNLLARKGYPSGLIIELLKEKNIYKEDES